MQTATPSNAEPGDLALDDIVPLKEAAQRPEVKRLFPKPNALTYAVKNRHRNGMAEQGVVLLVQGKLCVALPRLTRWVANQAA